MPTGYTAAVQDGTITTLHGFAMSCARAFGALITMRDDPSSAQIPERFEPQTDYYDRGIAEAQERLAQLQAMDTEQIAAACAAAEEAETQSLASAKANAEAAAGRYRAMLEKVEAWTAPTEDHAEFKRFMLDQLESSLRFDCQPQHEEKPALTPEAWQAAQLESAAWSRDYHTDERRKEIERTERRNQWIAALRASLAEPST